MIPRSLRLRLLLGAAIAIFLALAAAWAAMTLLFEHHIERRIELDLRREGLQLAAGVRIAADGTLQLIRQPADVRFSTPASGLYWQVAAQQDTLRSRSLWDQILPPPGRIQNDAWSKRIVTGPFEPRLLLIERPVRPRPGGETILLQLGHEEKSLMAARAEFAAELALFMVLLWLILAAAVWVQVALGLRPLLGMRQQVEALQHNAEARLDAASIPEIAPLTRAINDLADARARDLSRARRRAADLAHGLKTPLAALSAQSRRAREAGAVAAADGLDRAIAAAAAAVGSELARSRAAAIQGSPSHRCTALPVIEAIIAVVERTEFGANLVFQAEIRDGMQVPLAPEDFMELMGALIENAARFARRRVRIASHASQLLEKLTIEDDGPGIEPEHLATVLARGGRLDEFGGGHGFGLAIAHELAEATCGEMTLSRSELGGLKVTITWPALLPDALEDPDIGAGRRQ